MMHYLVLRAITCEREYESKLARNPWSVRWVLSIIFPYYVSFPLVTFQLLYLSFFPFFFIFHNIVLRSFSWNPSFSRSSLEMNWSSGLTSISWVIFCSFLQSVHFAVNSSISYNSVIMGVLYKSVWIPCLYFCDSE